MKKFTVNTGDNQVLCDTPRCYAEIRYVAAGERVGGADDPRVEVVLCVIEGDLNLWDVSGTYSVGSSVRAAMPNADHLKAMQGVQIPAGRAWSATAGVQGAKILRVNSPHPGFDPAKALMPPLENIHHFNVTDGQKLVYTDYVRGGVLTFAPGFAADKHFHQDADEIFWFFQGACRVGVPDGPVDAPAGTIVVNPAGEWHIIENVGDEPLLMFVTVTPNIVPSHTFFDTEGQPFARSMQPLTHP
jgi:mannose-6-phosphate isomerase-like protein (cupin superfamily)